MSRWVGVNGFEAEVITLDGRRLIRLRQYGALVAYCRTVAELARHVDLADLVEVFSLQLSRRS